MIGKNAIAQTEESKLTGSCDRQKRASEADDQQVSLNNDNPEIIDNNTIPIEPRITLAGLTLPSLWWTRQQFDPFGGRLISNWLADPEIKQIKLTVNWQLWTLLDYLGRYRFVNQFGTVAREYGYELYILNNQKQCLASYQYNLESSPAKWEITLEQSERDSL